MGFLSSLGSPIFGVQIAHIAGFLTSSIFEKCFGRFIPVTRHDHLSTVRLGSRIGITIPSKREDAPSIMFSLFYPLHILYNPLRADDIFKMQ